MVGPEPPSAPGGCRCEALHSAGLLYRWGEASRWGGGGSPRLAVEPVLCSPYLPFLLAAWPLLCGLGDRPSGHGARGVSQDTPSVPSGLVRRYRCFRASGKLNNICLGDVLKLLE